MLQHLIFNIETPKQVNNVLKIAGNVVVELVCTEKKIKAENKEP